MTLRLKLYLTNYHFLQGPNKERSAWGALCWQSGAWGQEAWGGGVASPDGGVAGQNAARVLWPAWEPSQGEQGELQQKIL